MVRIFLENMTDKKIADTIINAMKKTIVKIVTAEYPEHKFEVNVTLCDNDFIRTLNDEYRGKDTPTDVLSFPLYDFDTPKVMTQLGDIIISLEKAKEQATELGTGMKRELCFLVAHSSLHLLGYTHDTEEELEIMVEKQEKVLTELGILRVDEGDVQQ